MRWYTVVGEGLTTGKSRTRRYYAVDETDARQQALADETRPDTITPDPPRPATEKQYAYAHRLRLTLPAEATVEQASDIIAHATKGPIAPELAAYLQAVGRPVPLSQEIGARMITAHEEIQWYLLNVARHQGRGTWRHPKNPDIPLDLDALATAFAADQQAATSFKQARPADWTGEDWPRLITISSNGVGIESSRINAYKRAAELLGPPPKEVATRRAGLRSPAAPPRQLTSCRACGHQVSHDAKTCPTCGTDDPGQPAWMRLLTVMTTPGVLLALVVLWTAVRCTSGTSSNPPTPAQQAHTCGGDMACVARVLTPDAALPCRAKIETSVKHPARWIGGGPNFVDAQWSGSTHAVVALIGSGLELEFEPGKWFRYRYRCLYNPATKMADYATVSPRAE
jgi:hypothetical protein